jgi:hypothetical protein
MLTNIKYFVLSIMLLASILMNGGVLAGPPYISNDPVPVDYKNFQIYLFAMGNKTNTSVNIQAPFVEVDYGIFPEFEINMQMGIDSNNHQTQHQNGMGVGDVQLGMTYRFLQETEYLPQLGFLPAVFIPMGDNNRGFGNGRPYYTLQCWGQKSLKQWIVNFGGGYVNNPPPAGLNYFLGGLLIQNVLNEYLTVGGEFFSQGANNETNGSTIIANAGVTYSLSKHTTIVFSAGHSIKGMEALVAYLGFQWCFEAGC